MKALIEMDFLLYGCRVFVEMEIPKGLAASEIEHRKGVIEDRILRGPNVGEYVERRKE